MPETILAPIDEDTFPHVLTFFRENEQLSSDFTANDLRAQHMGHWLVIDEVTATDTRWYIYDNAKVLLENWPKFTAEDIINLL